MNTPALETPIPSSQTPGWKRSFAPLNRFLDWLTAPSPAVSEVGDRRLARFQAIISLMFACMTGIGMAATVMVNQSVTESGFVTLAAMTSLALVVYVLSRSRYFKVGSWLFVWSLAIVGFILLPSSDDPASTVLATIIVAYALGSVLLPVPGMSALVVVTVFGLFLMSVIYPETITPQVVGSIGGTTAVIGIILSILAGLREGVEKRRLQDVRLANDELRLLSASLEQRVAERTRDLALAGQVGRSLAQQRDLDRLLTEAVELIQKSFNLYYTQIYLLDPGGRSLVLRAGTGEVAAELLRRGHRLEVGLASINGRVALERRPVFVGNTASSPVFRPNPLLPLTRSEAAVPLITGDRLVGVLDLQSATTGAFSEDSRSVFETMAGQLAVAIDNAALLARLAQTQEQQAAAARGQAQRGWSDYLNAIQRGEVIRFGYGAPQAGDSTGDVETHNYASLQNNRVGAESLLAPIEIAGAAIGSIHFEREGGAWSEDDRALVQAVAERIGRQLDALRLLEQAEDYRTQAETSARRLQREGWDEYLVQRSTALDFEYDLVQVHPTGEAQDVRPPASPDEVSPAEAATMNFPIQIAGSPLGELQLAGLDSLDPAQSDMLQTIVQRLAEHVDGLRLTEQTRLALASTEALFSGSERVVRAASFDQNLAALVQSTAVGRFERASLMLFNRDWQFEAGEQGVPESGQLVAVWERSGGAPRAPVGVSYPLSSMSSPGFLRPDRPAFVPDVSQAQLSPAVRAALSVFGRSIAIFPLVAGEQWIGMLTVGSNELVQLSEAELRQVQSLASQAAAVLQGLRLLDQSRARAAREQTLRQVSERVRSAMDIERVLQTAAREVGQALGRNVTVRLAAPAAAAEGE